MPSRPPATPPSPRLTTPRRTTHTTPPIALGCEQVPPHPEEGAREGVGQGGGGGRGAGGGHGAEAGGAARRGAPHHAAQEHIQVDQARPPQRQLRRDPGPSVQAAVLHFAACQADCNPRPFSPDSGARPDLALRTAVNNQLELGRDLLRKPQGLTVMDRRVRSASPHPLVTAQRCGSSLQSLSWRRPPLV